MKCGSLVCGKRLAGMGRGTWRRTPRRFCGGKCKTDAWALRRAASLLGALPERERRSVLRALFPGILELDGFALPEIGEWPELPTIAEWPELPPIEEWPELPAINWDELKE